MDDATTPAPLADILTETTVDIVSAYVGHNSVTPTDLSKLITEVHTALRALNFAPEVALEAPLRPAVSIKKSITPDYLVCLDDGKKFKSLKRHISSLGMTPDEYRTKWGLPSDYPMVAPNYSAVRSGLAMAMVLGGSRSFRRESAAAVKPQRRKKWRAAAWARMIYPGAVASQSNCVSRLVSTSVRTSIRAPWMVRTVPIGGVVSAF